MTKEQALQLVKQVFAQQRATLTEHETMQQAIKTLEDAVIDQTKK